MRLRQMNWYLQKKVSESVNKVKKSVSEKAKDKIDKARKRREELIKKYKSERGSSLYAGVGLTKEGIS